MTAKCWTETTSSSKTVISFHSYLRDRNLCGRADDQSFIKATEEEVKKICTPEGEYVYNNLCRSRSKMTVYNVKSDTNCNDIKVTSAKRKVVVACDKVGEECLPVHYQAKINRKKRKEKGKNCV